MIHSILTDPLSSVQASGHEVERSPKLASAISNKGRPWLHREKVSAPIQVDDDQCHDQVHQQGRLTQRLQYHQISSASWYTIHDQKYGSEEYNFGFLVNSLLPLWTLYPKMASLPQFVFNYLYNVQIVSVRQTQCPYTFQVLTFCLISTALVKRILLLLIYRDLIAQDILQRPPLLCISGTTSSPLRWRSIWSGIPNGIS